MTDDAPAPPSHAGVAPGIDGGPAARAAAGRLPGMSLGTIERRFGLMSSHEDVRIERVVGASGDLAVADRLAFLGACEAHRALVVVEVDGWYAACTLDRPVEAGDLELLVATDGAPRVLALATVRGVLPLLGPIAAPLARASA